MRPGVELGDIGPKHAYDTKDNGYALFSKFRIPRSALLSRYVQVGRDGSVRRQGNPKLAYFAMMHTRLLIVTRAYQDLSRALAIALRYCAYRKQFRTLPDGSER